MSKSVAIVQSSQAGRANSQGSPLWSWLPSGLTMLRMETVSRLKRASHAALGLGARDFGHYNLSEMRVGGVTFPARPDSRRDLSVGSEVTVGFPHNEVLARSNAD